MTGRQPEIGFDGRKIDPDYYARMARGMTDLSALANSPAWAWCAWRVEPSVDVAVAALFIQSAGDADQRLAQSCKRRFRFGRGADGKFGQKSFADLLAIPRRRLAGPPGAVRAHGDEAGQQIFEGGEAGGDGKSIGHGRECGLSPRGRK